MCGIFGYVLDEKRAPSLQKRATLIYALAAGNTQRGRHSWGAYVHEGKAEKNGEVLKALGPMVNAPDLDTLALGTTLMAHTRYATLGAVTTENSHPFAIGDILGSHNGMVYNHADLTAKYGRKIEVDSEHLFHHVNEGRSFSDVVGYGTVEYVKMKGDLREVHLCRMSHGQLAVYGLGPRHKPYGIVWSSDEYHLRDALKAAGIRGFPYVLRDSRVYIASADGVLYKTDAEHRLSTERRLSAAEQARNEAKTRGGETKPAPVTSFTWDPPKIVTPNLCAPAAEIPGLTRMPNGTYVTKAGKVVEPDLTEGEDLFAQPDEDNENDAALDRALREYGAAAAAGKVN